MIELEAAVGRIGSLNAAAMTAAAIHLDQLTKPPGSLGRLESLAIQLAGITGDWAPRFERRAIVVMAADHGVARRGVSAYPREVTAQMVANFVAGGAAINVLGRAVHAEVVVVDVGVAGPIPPPGPGGSGAGGRLLARRLRPGTDDLSVGPAMSRGEAEAAMRVGLAVAAQLALDGIDLLAVGEMGIGNTTAASAIVASMTGRPPAEVTGRGTGIDVDVWTRKVAIIEHALELHRPDPSDPVGVLATVGGLEIAALVGLMIGAASHAIPVILDGFITGAAALVAAALCPGLSARLLAGHRSVEPGHRAALDQLGLVPLLDLDLRLGEGSGAALAIPIIDAACRLRDEMATFSSASISGPGTGEQGNVPSRPTPTATDR
jgi:nicotinate-nucleotide--dimethylbenzimidazole phosphoribosyltransferase